MPFTIRLVTTDQNKGQEILQEVSRSVHQELLRLEEKFSPFRSGSMLYQFQGGDKLVLLDPEFQEVYTLAQAAKIETAGYFDPYYAKVYNPTGLVKGWAIEKVFKSYLQPLLARDGVEAVALNGAGDMQFDTALGSDFSWQIGVEHPDYLDRLLTRFAMKKGSVATTGISKRGQHLTIKGQADLKQVTVIGHGLTWTDVWATAGFAAGKEAFNQLISHHYLSGCYYSDDGLINFKEGIIN